MRFTRSIRRGVRAAAVLVLSMTMLVPATADTAGLPSIKVMTRNLYLGTALDGLVAAQTPQEFLQAATQGFANVVATDFPTRADALAREIRNAAPDVVGLQEVTLWRQQTPADSPANAGLPNADVVVYDFLTLLTQALARRGAHYTVALSSTNADVEAARIDPQSPNGLSDVRLTDRDVILVRRGLLAANPQQQHFAAQLALPVVGRTLEFTRGWQSVDIAKRRTVFRFFNTHLEVGQAGPLQVAQAAELLGAVAASPLPVVAVGDFNSPAAGSGTPTYALLVQGGLTDAWPVANGARAGFTCCQNELLTNRRSELDTRIDLVLTAGPWRATQARVYGAWPFRLSPPPLWASDHAGVAATLALIGSGHRDDG